MNLQICGYCIKELDAKKPGLKSELEAVARQNGVVLSHGACKDHAVEQLRGAGIPEEKIQAVLQRAGASIPDLRQHPELIQSYLQGNFSSQQPLKERLQKLARK